MWPSYMAPTYTHKLDTHTHTLHRTHWTEEKSQKDYNDESMMQETTEKHGWKQKKNCIKNSSILEWKKK